MKGYTRGQREQETRGGNMPSQGFSKLCYKRAFDSGEGMGRGWEWVGPVRGRGGGGVVKTLALLREMCVVFVHRKSDKTVTSLDLTTKDNVTRGSFRKHTKRFAFIVASSVTNRDNRQSDVLGVIRTNYVDGVDRSLVGFTKKHVDKAEWTEKRSMLAKLLSKDVEGNVPELENMSIYQNVDKSAVVIGGLYCICCEEKTILKRILFFTILLMVIV